MKFQFQLEGEHLNSSQWAYDNGYIEGDVQIYVYGTPFFQAQCLNVVELAIQLGIWLEDVRKGNVRDFAYDSLDHDELILLFTVKDGALRVLSPWQHFELTQLLTVKTVEVAVQLYLIQLNEQLHQIDYVEKLDRFITEDVSDNRKAIMLFEQNDYESAFALFKRLAKEQPSVQSLNNLAWLYLREEEELEVAEQLLQQLLTYEPTAAFPFMMLGEISLRKQRYEQAKQYLLTAISFNEERPAMFNLAIAHFHLGEYKEAAAIFNTYAENSDLTKLNEVVSLLYAKEYAEAEQLLDAWDEESDHYTGAIEIADVYIELGAYEKARIHFEKEWTNYFATPYIVKRYSYTLMQIGEQALAQKVIGQSIESLKEEYLEEQQTQFDEHWTVADQREKLAELTEQMSELAGLYDQLQRGYVPTFDYELYVDGGCQLFGCMQHSHPEYDEGEL
ncbi:MAG: tetratricopeptide repeat protein [Lysinibacillus sp.]